MNKNLGYIICEAASVEKPYAEIVKEDHNRLVAEVILQDANVRNRNGRYYSLDELTRGIAAKRIQELLNAGQLLGENGHPQDKSLSRQSIIDPCLQCIDIMKIWIEGNDIKALVRGANSTYGDYFDKDLRMGKKPSYSLRALGRMENTKNGAEVKNMTIITWDRVIFPSHERAYTQGIVQEGANLVELSEGMTMDEMIYKTNKAGNKVVMEESASGILLPVDTQQARDFIMNESANLQTVINSMDVNFNSYKIISESKIQLCNNVGDTMIINLEDHIQNELMNYTHSMFL